MKKIVYIFCLLCASFFNSQNIKIITSYVNGKISLNIFSKITFTIDRDLVYTNDWMYQVKSLGIANNKLTLFVFDKNSKLIDSQVATKLKGKLDILPEELERLTKQHESQEYNSRINFVANQSENIDYYLKVFDNQDEVFNKYPCEMFKCWYDFYTLEKGKKYKMQVQLKIKSKVYKSNIVEFTY